MSESDVYRRQILTTEVDTRAVRVKGDYDIKRIIKCHVVSYFRGSDEYFKMLNKIMASMFNKHHKNIILKVEFCSSEVQQP